MLPLARETDTCNSSYAELAEHEFHKNEEWTQENGNRRSFAYSGYIGADDGAVAQVELVSGSTSLAINTTCPPISPKPRRKAEADQQPKRVNNVSPFPSPSLSRRVNTIHAHRQAFLSQNGSPKTDLVRYTKAHEEHGEEELEQGAPFLAGSKMNRPKRKLAYSPLVSSRLAAFIDQDSDNDDNFVVQSFDRITDDAETRNDGLLPVPIRRKLDRSQFFLQRRDSLNPTAGVRKDRNFGSLVGSYEESIMAGRMSAKPSSPSGFVCNIGVLGSGKSCKSSLRCPPHQSVPFKAWFYECLDNQEVDGEGWTSPYVGTVDIEGQVIDFSAPNKRVQVDTLDANGVLQRSKPAIQEAAATTETSGYRVPAKGQIQLMLRNQNHTAIKLFLIPFDLSEMPTSTRTFIRQKVYEVYDDGATTLKSAAHCQFVRTARGRIYLHRSVRLVFTPQSHFEREKISTVTTVPKNPRFLPL